MQEMQKVRIFFSCSGKNTLSHKVAESFREILPRLLLNAVEPPYIFTHDLQPGEWYEQLMNTIAQAKAGLIFITHENRFSPWIMFEAGAIAGGIGANSLKRVMPVLIDLSSTDLQTNDFGQHCGHPLEHSTQFHCDDKESLFSLVKAIGHICRDAGTLSLPEQQLELHFEGQRATFDTWYQQKLQSLLLGSYPSDENLNRLEANSNIRNVARPLYDNFPKEDIHMNPEGGENQLTLQPRPNENRPATPTTILPRPHLTSVSPPSPTVTSRSSGLADRLNRLRIK